MSLAEKLYNYSLVETARRVCEIPASALLTKGAVAGYNYYILSAIHLHQE
jgi:hypothetical protein